MVRYGFLPQYGTKVPITVPFIDLKRQIQPIRDDMLNDWQSCLDETRFVGGTFEATLAQPPAAAAIGPADLEVGRAFCRNVLNLPLFAGITDDEVRRSVEAPDEVVHELA